jgi:hypothetical protein
MRGLEAFADLKFNSIGPSMGGDLLSRESQVLRKAKPYPWGTRIHQYLLNIGGVG